MWWEPLLSSVSHNSVPYPDQGKPLAKLEFIPFHPSVSYISIYGWGYQHVPYLNSCHDHAAGIIRLYSTSPAFDPALCWESKTWAISSTSIPVSYGTEEGLGKGQLTPAFSRQGFSQVVCACMCVKYLLAGDCSCWTLSGTVWLGSCILDWSLEWRVESLADKKVYSTHPWSCQEKSFPAFAIQKVTKKPAPLSLLCWRALGLKTPTLPEIIITEVIGLSHHWKWWNPNAFKPAKYS